MPSGAMASLTANGILPPAGISEKTFAEILELEKIIKLRDEVITGTHPRIKRPAHPIGKLGPRPLQSPAFVSRPSTAETKARPSTISGQSSHLDEPVRPLPKSPEPRQLIISKNAVSEINPVLLSKPEDPVRADILLHRQQLEQALEEQHEQRRGEPRQRHPHQELVSGFDVSDVLEKALQIVHPVEGVRGESSDHNSYYSSQQNDSPVEEVENPHGVQLGQEQSRPERAQAEDMEIDDLHAAEDAEKQRISPLPAALRDSDYWGGTQKAEPYVEELRQPYTSMSHGSSQIERKGRRYYTAEPRDVYEGPSQVESSRGPRIGFQGNSDYIELEVEAEHHNRRDRETSISHADTAQAPARATSHESPEITVVRNHISSPLAPRPERVSPLAVARMPPLAQEHQHDEFNSQRVKRPLQIHSPGSPSQPSTQRKRRRPFSSETESRQIPARQLADSSPPQIKEEPLSPMPLSSVPSIRPAKRRPQIQGSSLERQPSRDSTNRDSFAKPQEQPQRYRNDTDISASAIPLRVSSRGSVQRIERDGHHPRHYARVRYSRRQQSPTYSVQVSPTDPRPVRATSHVFDRLVVDQSRHYREPSRSQLGQYPTAVRSGRSRSPPSLRERYPSLQQDVIMAPSPLPHRIALDKHGREYIPGSAVIRRSAAPPGRQGEIGPYFERAAAGDPVLRVPIPVPDDLCSDRTFVERFPPFPTPSRRIIEQSPIGAVDYRAYRDRDFTVPQGAIPVAREEYVQSGDYPERRISHFVIPREYVPRMQSARPEGGRYETARDFVPRIQSVHPEPVGRDYATGVRPEAERRDYIVPPQNVREYSVRTDEGQRDFVPAENERYSFLPSGRRYADHALIERPTEVPRETGSDAYGDDMRKYGY
ncbi:hypothetical protein GP486_001167 [Trichoglossum hirsutum]|uniref:Uncharacterized protein n=1 Tax=Trichoglossum hirsutum TaxID=265104 RepID=A0A9P8LHJ7_9PEZI|nr:hypothetical protein GP486_001167 [Trichoglossum hirsutum]